ncbi:MAG: DUF4249 domain-containing protein [Bacteroidetes bacterium]|nr:DUF4249 domain-containing protein [Bacteroidota bacterium]
MFNFKKLHIVKYTLTLLFASVILTGCEKVVDVDLEEGEKLLVVDAWLTNQDKPQVVRLTESAPYFSNVPAPVISSAQVKVKDLTNLKEYVFSYAGDGNYVFTPSVLDTFGIVNHSYQLVVDYDGDSYVANSFLNRTTLVDTIEYEFREESIGVKEGYFAFFVGQDSIGKQDFYWVRTYRNNSFLNKPGQINVCVDGSFGSEGNNGSDGIYFIPPIAQGINDSDDPYQLGDSLRVEIHSLTAGSYFYITQMQGQLTNGGLFAITPENLTTNIVKKTSATSLKAVGWFNMAAVHSKGVRIQ